MPKIDAFREILQFDAPTSELTWLKLGGPIEYLACPRSEQELLALLNACQEDGIETRALGDGSALLVSNVGAPGMAIQLSEPAFTDIVVESPRVVAGAGAKLGRLVTTAASAGLSGIEGLVGVPGTVGAAVVTNASTTDVSLGQWVTSARVATYDGKIVELSADELVFGYRDSNLDVALVLSVELQLDPDSAETLTKRLQKMWIVREQARPDLKQGEGYARLFKNPRGERAADLIKDAGFSGASVGGASICQGNPNLVKTSPNCSSAGVARLAALIQEQVRARIGVELESELTVW